MYWVSLSRSFPFFWPMQFQFIKTIFIKTRVPKFIQGYNGKPALVTKSGTFIRHENYIEFIINVNMWAFIAKKGLYALVPTFPDFIFNVGFTIEARKDEEMPGQFFRWYPIKYGFSFLTIQSLF